VIPYVKVEISAMVQHNRYQQFMKTIEIKKFIDFHKVIEDYSGSNFLFRGHTNFEWNLLPKIGRPEFRKTVPKIFKEEYVLNSWKRYASHFIIKQPVDDWDWISLSQHHGLATRLLDWTKNPLIALFFATCDFNIDKDGSVFIFDFNNDGINTQVAGPFDINRSGVFFPKGISARIISQRGVFSISNKPEKPLDKLLSNYTFTLTS